MDTSSAKEEMFTYPPLKTGQIRLVFIAPRSMEDSLMCSIMSMLPGEITCGYIALSYTWGSDPPTHKIKLNGKQFWIRENLAAAMLQLRHEEKIVPVWIDAICIDQTNIPERNDQVQHMVSIYKDASRVVVWLGEADENSDIAMIEDLPSRLGFDTNSFGLAVEGRVDVRILKALYQFSQRPWWERIWIVQEAMLATSLDMMCGKDQLTWESLERNMVLAVDAQALLDQGVESVSGQMNASARLIGFWRTFVRRNIPASLLALLNQFRHCKATDPRDKVFGLVALSKEMNGDESSFTIDYNMPVDTVYRKIAQYIIQRDQNLEILACTWSPKRLSGLPSWVPDWSQPIHEIHTPFRNQELNSSNRFYNAGGTHPVDAWTIEGGTKLAVKGLLTHKIGLTAADVPIDDMIGIVQRALIKQTGGVDEVDPFQAKWIRTITANNNEAKHLDAKYIGAMARWLRPGFRTRYRPGSDREEERHGEEQHDHEQAPSANKVPDTDSIARRNTPAETCSDLRYFHPDECEETDFRQDIEAALKNRVFFMTPPPEQGQSGEMGIGPVESMAGDEIFVPLGGQVPLVVRRRGDMRAGEKEVEEEDFVLIGECYLDGFMDGEAVRDVSGEGEDQDERALTILLG